MEKTGTQALQFVVQHRLGLRRAIIVAGIAYYLYEQRSASIFPSKKFHLCDSSLNPLLRWEDATRPFTCMPSTIIDSFFLHWVSFIFGVWIHRSKKKGSKEQTLGKNGKPRIAVDRVFFDRLFKIIKIIIPSVSSKVREKELSSF
jgi:hypothetical protein